jgi:hypothetical protein
MDPSDSYISFLLRFQRVHHGDQARWLASTQCAQTGERRWFADVDGLIAFLHEAFDADAQQVKPCAPECGSDNIFP